MKSDNRYKLNEALLLCNIHRERMCFALGKIKMHFPLNREKYLRLQPEELSFLDQLIFRFSKLQDSMGGRLFPAVLESLGEEIKEMPFIDRLIRLEEMNVIPDADEWLVLRETRNLVTHEYPFIADEFIEGLNLLYKHCDTILSVLNQVIHFLNKRTGI